MIFKEQQSRDPKTPTEMPLPGENLLLWYALHHKKAQELAECNFLPGGYSPEHDSVGTLIPDFWTPSLSEINLCCLQATHSMAICYSSLNNQRQYQTLFTKNDMTTAKTLT